MSNHGENAQEFAILVRAGMPPMEAIKAATWNAADLIGDTEDIGTVQPGRYADIIAVSGDPLTDLTVLEHVRFVMKGGAVVRDEHTARPGSAQQVPSAHYQSEQPDARQHRAFVPRRGDTAQDAVHRLGHERRFPRRP
jgi:adenine deaminase